MWRAILTNLQRHGSVLALALAFAGGCTPQKALIGSLLPDGTIPVMLGQLDRVDDRNRRGIVELESRGDWSGLAKFAEDNLARDQRNADWWMVAGYAYSQLGEQRRAIERYAEAVRLAPEETLGWSLLAQSYRAAGQPEQAVRTLQNALLVRQDSAAMFFLLGEAYRDLRRDQDAIGSYRQAVQLEGGFARAWLGMGKAYARLGRAEELTRVREVLEKLDPALARELGNPPPER